MMAGKDEPADIAITVNQGYAVAVDGVQHGSGSTLKVDSATAERWLGKGWARLSTEEPYRPAKPPKSARPVEVLDVTPRPPKSARSKA